MSKFTSVLLTRGIETIRSNSGEKFFWSANSPLFQCYLFDQKDGVPDIRAQQSLPEKIIFRAEMVTLTSNPVDQSPYFSCNRLVLLWKWREKGLYLAEGFIIKGSYAKLVWYTEILFLSFLVATARYRLTSQRDRTIKTEFRQMGYFRISRGIREIACGISWN